MATRRVIDFLLGPDGDLVVDLGDFQLAADEVAIRQSISQALQFFLGEWFLDEEVGVPYFQRIFIKNPSLVEVREHFRTALLGVRGVREVLSLDVQNLGRRLVQVLWNVNTDVGELAGSTERTA